MPTIHVMYKGPTDQYPAGHHVVRAAGGTQMMRVKCRAELSGGENERRAVQRMIVKMGWHAEPDAVWHRSGCSFASGAAVYMWPNETWHIDGVYGPLTRKETP